MFNHEQEKKALHYSIKWLEQEIKEIDRSIDSCLDPVTKGLLRDRLAELRRDYKQFEEINNR